MTTRTMPWLLALFLLGCSADEANSTGEPGSDGAAGNASVESATCADESRAEEFVPGMDKKTDSGLTVALVSAEPAPPERLDNSWVIFVQDSDGEPVEGAQLTLDPQMPDHGHGSPREAVVKELGDGEYRAEPIALIMPGYWSIEVSVAVDDDAVESVSFGFCVP